MKKITISPKTIGEYTADVAFCLMEGGHSETKNINKTTNPVSYSWTVADQLIDGGILIREMSEKEYEVYRLDKLKELKNKRQEYETTNRSRETKTNSKSVQQAKRD